MHAVKRWPAPEDWSSDTDGDVFQSTSTETCSSCTSSSYSSASLSVVTSEAPSDNENPPPPAKTPCFTHSGWIMGEAAASRRLRHTAHIMEDSARMPDCTVFASSCAREPLQPAEIHPTAGVDRPRGGSPGRPRARVDMAARVDETSTGRGREAAKDPALAIAACPEVAWRLEMGWFYGCRY